jgi:hypothetical protein
VVACMCGVRDNGFISVTGSREREERG